MFCEKVRQVPVSGNGIQLLLSRVSIVFVMFVTAVFVCSGPALAQEGAQGDDVQFGLEIYGWGAFIGGESATGSDIDVDLDDIVDALNFGAMGVVGVRKGKWSFTTDILYMDLEDDNKSTIPTSGGSLGVNTDLELRAWIITPSIGYRLVDSDKASLDIRGGARYLYLDVDLERNVNTPSRPLYAKVSDSGNVWDAIIGVNGKIAFNERWYAPYYLDIGTGDSDFTWQVAAGIGYKFDICDVVLEYRYLSWDFDDNPALDNLNVNGPMIGAKFEF